MICCLSDIASLCNAKILSKYTAAINFTEIRMKIYLFLATKYYKRHMKLPFASAVIYILSSIVEYSCGKHEADHEAPIKRKNILHLLWKSDSIQLCHIYLILFHSDRKILIVNCQCTYCCHAYPWQIGPFWQDTLELSKRAMLRQLTVLLRCTCIKYWSLGIMGA